MRQLHRHLLPFAALFLGFLAFNATATTYYVDINCANPTPPYTNWSTASTNVQSAVNQTTNGDLVLVNPGVYQSAGYTAPDGTLSAVVITNSLSLQSTAGATATFINGRNAMHCIYLANDASVVGFTLTNGLAENGGGAYCESVNSTISNCLFLKNIGTNGGGVYSGTLYSCQLINNSAPSEGGGANSSILSNCVVAGNIAGIVGGGVYSGASYNCWITNNSASGGGGSFNGSLYNCLLTGNSAGNGGGAQDSQLNGCTIAGNSASNQGGGTWNASCANSIIYSNASPNGANWFTGFFWYCCTTPGPPDTGIIAAAPLFVNEAAGDFHLQSNSPCINAGDNGSVVTAYDLDGNSPAQIVDCIITGNVATNEGGGVYEVQLLDCTVCFNSTTNQCGGDYSSGAYNSIIYYNSAPQNPDVPNNPNVLFCCLGSGQLTPNDNEFTNAPLFVNAAAGDFHLLSNSPCINSGINGYAHFATDFDGNPRIVAGNVDIGAYEYQTPASEIPYVWLYKYGLTITNNIDTSSPNGTSFDVYQDWIAGLNPTNPASVLAMLPLIVTSNTSGITVSWQGIGGINYNLQRSTNLAAQAAFSTIQTNISGQTGTVSYTDTTATNGIPYFYRVGVQ